MKEQLQATQKYYIEEYSVHQMIGDGGQASVYLASKGTQLFAIKVYLTGSTREEAFRKEVYCLNKLRSRYTIKMIEFRESAKVRVDERGECKRHIIVLEYAENLDLFEYISKQGAFEPASCKKIFRQLLEAIQFIHDQFQCHRDLKCENLLLDSNFDLKVSDFGLSADSQGDDSDGFRTTKVGTEGYRSPQMESAMKYNGLESDVFAAGVILFMMYTGSPPFLSTRSSDKIYRMIRQGNYTRFWNLHSKKRGQNHFPPEFQKLMNSFFSFDPQKRPTLQSLKYDTWLNSVHPNQSLFKEELSTKLNAILEMDEWKHIAHETVGRLKKSLRDAKLSEDSTVDIVITADQTDNDIKQRLKMPTKYSTQDTSVVLDPPRKHLSASSADCSNLALEQSANLPVEFFGK